MPTHNAGKDELRAIAHAAMLQRGLLPDFLPAVVAQANLLTHATSPSGAAVRDLRDRLWASIDNDDSRDLDQLSVAEPLPDGRVKVLVAIADVDALVAKGSAVDAHAWTNTTSVYTAAAIFPMLPEKLSIDLTSQLRIQDRAAQALRQLRHARGALRLETLQVRAVFDAGTLSDLRPDAKNRAKELIEDFMITANGVTARYLDRKGLPSLRRVLRTPRRWDRIIALAAGRGSSCR